MLALSVALAACSGGGDSGDPTASSTVEPTAGAEPTVTATANPERVVLEWRREGGIAGFCDGMTVMANHRATLGTCDDPGADLTGQFLPVDWIGALEGWRDRFASFELREANPPGTADGMSVTLRLEGRGSAIATEAEQREIANLAAELFVALQEGQRRVAMR